MKRQATPWLLASALTVVAWLDGPGRASAQPPKKDPDRPAAMVIAQWQQVGAVFGWIAIDPQGDWRFHRETPAAGGLPAFRFNKAPAGKAKTLPSPDVPFGLSLGRSTNDADLKELAGLKQLQALNIEDTYTYGVTDEGLKALAPLTQLQALTDAAISELQTALPVAIITASRPPFTCDRRGKCPGGLSGASAQKSGPGRTSRCGRQGRHRLTPGRHQAVRRGAKGVGVGTISGCPSLFPSARAVAAVPPVGRA